MKKLIIAEKPKYARNIVEAIGVDSMTTHEGYYENDMYIVTNAYGHLYTLKDIEEYLPNYSENIKYKWTLANIPFIPDKFEFNISKDSKTKKADKGLVKQLKIISKLINRKDVVEIINAGDSDREGEIIVRIILSELGNTKPVKRLWVSDQSPSTIKVALNKSLENDSNFDKLADEGYARLYADWLYGINLTRYATLKSGKLLRVGRVISPVVNAIYERDLEIENFVPREYYIATSSEKTNNELITLTSKKEFDKSDLTNAQKLCNDYNKSVTRVTDVKSANKVVPAGKLYSLSKLQGVAGQHYKLSPGDTLKAVQSLYESGYVSYPRTNTEYLADSEKDKVAELIDTIMDNFNVELTFKDNKSIFDSKKVESHTALLPTGVFPNIDALSPICKKIYLLILNRFMAVFCAEDCIVSHSNIIIENDYEKFNLSGNVMVQKGWTAYDINTKKDNVLPKLSIGDIVNVDFKLEEKSTKPPSHYTIKSLGEFLENPFKNTKSSDLSDDDDYKAILSGAQLGTEATRSTVIDNAISNGYIELDNGNYKITDFGKYYVNTLNALGVSMDKTKTVELGVLLKKVNSGTSSISDVVSVASSEIYSTLANKDTIKVAKYTNYAKHFSKCPKCGNFINETYLHFECENPLCNFKLYKKDKFLASMGVVMDTSIAKSLLDTNKVYLDNLYSNKTKKTFAATVLVDFTGEFVKYKLDFEDNSMQTDKHPIGICPKCGRDVVENVATYNCIGDGCDFVMFKNDKYLASMGKTLTKTIAKDFLNMGKSNVKNLKSKRTGKKFNATILVDYSDKFPKYSMEFETMKGSQSR